jgi:short subunit dehydrogenase-like uncharacterized protein
MMIAARSGWMLYGAYGATGRLIVDEAVRRGHRPVLAGRNAAPLSALGQATGLSTLPLPLDDGAALRAALRAALSRVSCVLHAAGPYQLTGPSMRAACLATGCSYMDISGEIDDFTAALACDAPARAAGIGIIPGVGYGVVFAECLAAQVAQRLPDATWLRLSLATQTQGSSRGARRSVANTMVAGGREIREGTMRKRALAFSTWRAPSSDARAMHFAAAPMAEIQAAHRSTGFPNVVAGIPLPRAGAAVLRVAGPLLGKMLSWQAARAPGTSAASEASQSAEAIAQMRSRVWAEAGNAHGERAAGMLETGEGYRAAATAALRAVELQMEAPRVGALTPVQAFGASFALLVPGTRIQEL